MQNKEMRYEYLWILFLYFRFFFPSGKMVWTFLRWFQIAKQSVLIATVVVVVALTPVSVSVVRFHSVNVIDIDHFVVFSYLIAYSVRMHRPIKVFGHERNLISHLD